MTSNRRPGGLRPWPPRLLYVLTHLAYGGAETQVVELARRFAGRGWTVEVLSLMPVDGLTERLDEAGVNAPF